MSDAVIITGIAAGAFCFIIGSITVCVNIEEIARAGRATYDWWKKRGDE